LFGGWLKRAAELSQAVKVFFHRLTNSALVPARGEGRTAPVWPSW
jgi:hypothetical protein